MKYIIIQFLVGAFAVLIAIKPFRKTINLHRAVDSRAKASVTRCIDLGALEGRKVYAVTYTVDAPEPFDVLVTPCKKCYDVGKVKHINYENANRKNYYFGPSFFDRRFSTSAILIGGGAVMIIHAIVKLIITLVH